MTACLLIYATRFTGVGQDFTGLACGDSTPPAVSRSTFGSQALQRCSGLLNRGARSVTVAAHHFRGRFGRLKNR